MAAQNDFQKEQHGVAIRMVAALLVTLLVIGACLHWDGEPNRPLPDRLMAVAKAAALVLCWLAATIGNVARLRFFSTDDIAGSGSLSATANVRRANALLQNTLEQVTLAIPIYFILAVLVTSSAPLIIASATLFAVGRLLFWTGYSNGARARAFGFALTFYPSLVGLVICLVAVVQSSI